MNNLYEAIIEERDFQGARRHWHCQCLVANALKRVTGKTPTVGAWSVSFGSSGEFRYNVVQGEDVINGFDRGEDRATLLGKKVVITRA